MAKLKPGDRVICRLNEGVVINPYRTDYDEIKTFDIIACDSTGYYFFVAPYVFLKNTVKVDSYLLKKLKLDKKYLGDTVLHVTENFIYKIESQMEGCVCDHCHEFSYKALPNQEDGGFICWLCRDNPWR